MCGTVAWCLVENDMLILRSEIHGESNVWSTALSYR